ncbi:MAG: Rne/Rng family ribonuclease, partial [Deltaproteobacteria bacterium]|nr:Rne/Rng family ribonuclease [Deltaproteobacteria bacterium]
YIQSSMKEQIRGNIYKGGIARLEPSLGAIFVDYGRDKNGLLSMRDINPGFIPGLKDSKDWKRYIKKGMEIPVQVSREEKDKKGVQLTMNLSIPGRYMVLLPHHNLSGISRRIEDEAQRKRLKDIVNQLNPPSGMGLIVRTAGMDRTKAELSKDLNYLLRLWKSIEKEMETSSCPALIYREGDIIIRSIRDYFTPDINEILIDNEETYRRAVLFMKSVMPRYQKVIKLYKHTKKPLFTKYDLEKQLGQIYNKKVSLSSGGSIVIESTEAMVTIDVNSERSIKNKDIEHTAFLTNMEAVSEIARQLMLRDLGGLIVIDFIDMYSKEHIHEVEKAMKEGLKEDRAHVRTGKISRFGLMEMSRERLSPTLLEKSHITCPYCNGTGIIRSVESSAFMVLRNIQLYLNTNKELHLTVSVPEEVAIYMLNQQKSYLTRLEKEFSAEINISLDKALKRGEMRIEAIS